MRYAKAGYAYRGLTHRPRALRGIANVPAENIADRLFLLGPSRRRLSLAGPSSVRLGLSGESGRRIDLEGTGG